MNLSTKEAKAPKFLSLGQTFFPFFSKISAVVHPWRENPFKNQEKKQKKRGWEGPVNIDETYGRPRPAPWPGALLRWAAAPAANPQSWTCLDATRHVDSLRQERKKVGDVFSFCYTPLIHGCLGQGPLVCSQSSWPQQKTPYCLHELSTRVFIWEPEELGGAGDRTEWGRTLITQLLPLTFREDKNGPLLQREEKNRRTEEGKWAGPSFYNSTAEFGSEQEGGLNRRKPDPEEHQRVGGGSPPPAAMGLIQFLFLVLVYFLTHF